MLPCYWWQGHFCKNLLRFTSFWSGYRKMRSWNSEQLKSGDKKFKLYITKKEIDVLNINIRDKWKCISLFLFHDYFINGFLWALYLHTVFLWCCEKKAPGNRYLIQLVQGLYKKNPATLSKQWVNFFQNFNITFSES